MEPVEQLLTRVARSLGDHLDTPVVQIESKTTQGTDLQCTRTGEPPKTHTLDTSSHPGGDPYFFVHGCTLTGQKHSEHFAHWGVGVASPTIEPHSYG